MVEVCKECKNVLDKSEAAFRCLSCGCVMHLNQCSGLAKNLVKAIQELGSNILLLCNQCVDAGRRDVIVEREASARKFDPKRLCTWRLCCGCCDCRNLVKLTRD